MFPEIKSAWLVFSAVAGAGEWTTSTTTAPATAARSPRVFKGVSLSMRKRTESSMVKTGMEGWRMEKLVGEMRVRDCTAPRTFPAEKRPMARKRGRCAFWRRQLGGGEGGRERKKDRENHQAIDNVKSSKS